MGAWGVGIFSNDTASDVREDFRDLIADGVSAHEATTRLTDEYGVGAAADIDHDFWLALAATQHRVGHVTEGTIDRALRIIDDPAELERWPQSSRSGRAKALARLRSALAEPPPHPKKLKRRVRVTTNLFAGQHVVVDLAEPGPVLLRIQGNHEDKGGTYAVAIAIEWDGAERSLRRAHRLPPMRDPNRGHLAPESARSRDGEALGFILVGEPGDPPGLRVLPVVSGSSTPQPRWSSRWIAKWSELPTYFVDSRTPAALA